MTTTPEAMARRIISADAAEKPKRMAFRKPAVIAAAAAVLMAGGVSAAAATGLIDFNEIFGRVSVEDEAFGESLIGNAGNVISTVSDKDYAVELKGVTGTASSILASVEISRADGGEMQASDVVGTEPGASVFGNGFTSGRTSTTVTERGTIQLDIEMRTDYSDFINNNLSIKDRRVVLNEVCSFMDGGELRELSWSLEFDYFPSEESVKTINAAETGNNFEILLADGGTAECDVSEIALANMVGVIRCNSDCGLPAMDLRANDVRLTKKDGTEVSAVITTGVSDGAEMNLLMYYCADSDFANTLAVDLSEIEAISINSTVYELS